MARFLIRGSDAVDVEYARAFFISPPDVFPLADGETRTYPLKYTAGDPAATAFDLQWYATHEDADAMRDRLTDASRLPTAVFMPDTPNGADTTDLQDGNVTLTAPMSNGYDSPVGVIEMTQDTGAFIEPYIYLTEDVLRWGSGRVDYRDYQFRYWIGEPAIKLFGVEWYRTRLDANLQVRRLTMTDRLPRAEFMPETPNTNAGATDVQEGTLRLHPSSDANAYTHLEGLLCVSYLTEIDATEDASIRREQVFSNWDRR